MAIENGVQNAELGYILDPAFQIEGLNGKPVVGGWICIYEAGTDNKYISYENFDGAQNPFKVPLKSDGRAVILGDPSLSYDIYCYDSYGNQIFSRLNVQCNVPGTINLSGADTRIKNTDGTLDISLRTQANNVREYTINTRNKELGVESPLYFARNDESATIIGFSGDGYLTEDKFEYDNNNNITAYNHSAFASNGQTYSAGTNIDITDNVISVTGLPTSSDVENAISSAVTNIENKFEYNENNYITAYNNSAFAGKEYSAGDYVSIENDTISVTGLQPSGDYATKTELVSATSGKMDVTGMTAYQPSGDYATHDDLTAYQPVGDYYSASNPSGFITEDALTGLQPSGDYATRDDLTAYATTALVSSISSELYSAFSGISGDFVLSAGSGISIVDYPLEHTTVISVSGDYATNADIASSTSSLLPTSAVNGIFNSVFANTVNYFEKPTANAIQASQNDLVNVGQIVGSADSNFYIVPSGVLQVPNVITANTAGLTASGLSAHTAYGLTANGLTADAYNSGFSAMGISAGKLGPLFIEGKSESISANNDTGFTFSLQNTAFGTAQLGTAQSNNLVGMPAPKFEARNISGAGFSIEASGAKGYDENGNVVWDTSVVPDPSRLVSFAATQPAIVISPTPSSQSSFAPYLSASYQELAINYLNGPSAKMSLNGFSIKNENNKAEISANGISVTGNDVNLYVPETSASYSLRNSIQQSMIECDTATSAITSIAGSAIGGTGGGELPAYVSAATDYVTANSANIDATVSNVSANSGVWGGSALPISAGNGIKFEMVDGTLVASVTSTNETVLWSGNALTGTLNESPWNFEKLGFETSGSLNSLQYNEFPAISGKNMMAMTTIGSESTEVWHFTPSQISFNGNTFTLKSCDFYAKTSQTTFNSNAGDHIKMIKVIGINRIAGGN